MWQTTTTTTSSIRSSSSSSLSSALVGVLIGFGGSRLLQGQRKDDDEQKKQQQERLEQHARTMELFLKQFQAVNLRPIVSNMLGGGDAFFDDSDFDLQRFDTNATSRAMCESVGMMLPGVGFSSPTVLGRLKRHGTFRLMESTRERGTLEGRYQVDWTCPIGEGTFGAVYRAVDKRTGEEVAIKKISKQSSFDSETFQHEMNAMMHIRANGGHPNICGLHANYNQGGHLYLVLDMITGGEMFDHLAHHGAYSEADAARLVREVASALAFLHGLDIVHGDLKPENLMLSTEKCSNSVVKLVDFGSAQFSKGEDEALEEAGEQDKSIPSGSKRAAATTPAYSSPEFLASESRCEIDPAFDMWALGVILYIMLTGVHPFDLYGDNTDEEIQENIVSGVSPPLKRSTLTAHLSPHAIQLISKLLEWNPNKRMTARELLEDPWIRGETARHKKIVDSDTRLANYRSFKTRLEAKVFADMIRWSDDAGGKDASKRTSLIERAFKSLDLDDKGYVTAQQLKEASGHEEEGGQQLPEKDHQLSLSGFADLLGENMKNKYFAKGDFIYTQGEEANSMYFVDSGTIEVIESRTGRTQQRKTGDCFGEGALLLGDNKRSDTVRTLTPVHVIEISREHFEKYLAESSKKDLSLKLNLADKERGRKRKHAKSNILQLQSMKEKFVKKGGYVFQKGEPGNELYVLEQGDVSLTLDGKHVVSKVHQGTYTGEHSLIYGKPRNVNAICVSDTGCKLQTIPAKDFHTLLDSHPALREGVTDICYRREFKKSLCHALKSDFPREESELREAFNKVSSPETGVLEIDRMRELIHQFDNSYTESDIQAILHSLSLSVDDSNAIVAADKVVTWEKFRHIFGYGQEFGLHD